MSPLNANAFVNIKNNLHQTEDGKVMRLSAKLWYPGLFINLIDHP